MITEPCLGCGKDVSDNRLLVCYSCRDAVRSSLSGMARWYDAMLSPPVKPRRGMPSPPKQVDVQAPLSDRAIKVRTDILELLLSWAALHYEKTDDENPPIGIKERHQGTLNELIGYLQLHEDWFLSGEAAAGYVPELIEMDRVAQRTAAPGGREGVMIAVHTVDTGLVVEEECGAVWAKNGVNGTARCSSCGLKKPVREWFLLYPPQPEDELIDEEIPGHLLLKGIQVKVATIRQWRSRPRTLDDGTVISLIPLQQSRRNRIATARGVVDEYVRAAGLIL